MNKEPDNSRKILFKAVILIVSGAIVLSLLTVMYRRQKAKDANLREYFIDPPGNFYIAHPTLGFCTRPGEYTVTYRYKNSLKPWTFNVKNDEHGYRLTSNKPSEYSGMPEIWIFGCSWTWGYCINNEDTYPWMVQQKLESYNVKNFSITGGSNVHTLIQLREFLAIKGNTPLVTVVSYLPFHRERNSVKPVHFELVASFTQTEARYPIARLDNSGRILIDMVPLVLKNDKPDPSTEEAAEITKAVLREIYDLCADSGTKTVLFVQGGEMSDPIITYCKGLGYHLVDAILDYRNPLYNNQPYDGHPNADANRITANRLVPVLKDLLKNGE